MNVSKEAKAQLELDLQQKRDQHIRDVNPHQVMLSHLCLMLPWWCGWGCGWSPDSCSNRMSWRPSPPGVQCLCAPSQTATPPPAPAGTAWLDFSFSSRLAAHHPLFYDPIPPMSEESVKEKRQASSIKATCASVKHVFMQNSTLSIVDMFHIFTLQHKFMRLWKIWGVCVLPFKNKNNSHLNTIFPLMFKYDLHWRLWVCGKTAGEERGKQDVSLTFSHSHAPDTVEPAGTLHAQNAASLGTQMPSLSQVQTPSARAFQHHHPQLQFSHFLLS